MSRIGESSLNKVPDCERAAVWASFDARKQQRKARSKGGAKPAFLSNVPEVEQEIKYRLAITLVGEDADAVSKAVCECDDAQRLGEPGGDSCGSSAAATQDYKLPPDRTDFLSGSLDIPEEILDAFIDGEQLQVLMWFLESYRFERRPHMPPRAMSDPGGVALWAQPRRTSSQETMRGCGDAALARVTSTSSLLQSENRCLCLARIRGEVSPALVRLQITPYASFLETLPVPQNQAEALSTALVFLFKNGDPLTEARRLRNLSRVIGEMNARKIDTIRTPYAVFLLYGSDPDCSVSAAVREFLKDFRMDVKTVRADHIAGSGDMFHKLLGTIASEALDISRISSKELLQIPSRLSGLAVVPGQRLHGNGVAEQPRRSILDEVTEIGVGGPYVEAVPSSSGTASAPKSRRSRISLQSIKDRFAK